MKRKPVVLERDYSVDLHDGIGFDGKLYWRMQSLYLNLKYAREARKQFIRAGYKKSDTRIVRTTKEVVE